MAEGSEESGPATQIARQASDTTAALAGFLEQREPGQLLDEVRDFARRRPGTFLLGAALAGIVIGRLTRGAISSANSPDPTASDGSGNGSSTYSLPSVAAGTGPAEETVSLFGQPAVDPYPPTDEGFGSGNR